MSVYSHAVGDVKPLNERVMVSSSLPPQQDRQEYQCPSSAGYWYHCQRLCCVVFSAHHSYQDSLRGQLFPTTSAYWKLWELKWLLCGWDVSAHYLCGLFICLHGSVNIPCFFLMFSLQEHQLCGFFSPDWRSANGMLHDRWNPTVDFMVTVVDVVEFLRDTEWKFPVQKCVPGSEIYLADRRQQRYVCACWNIL